MAANADAGAAGVAAPTQPSGKTGSSMDCESPRRSLQNPLRDSRRRVAAVPLRWRVDVHISDEVAHLFVFACAGRWMRYTGGGGGEGVTR